MLTITSMVVCKPSSACAFMHGTLAISTSEPALPKSVSVALPFLGCLQVPEKCPIGDPGHECRRCGSTARPPWLKEVGRRCSCQNSLCFLEVPLARTTSSFSHHQVGDAMDYFARGSRGSPPSTGFRGRPGTSSMGSSPSHSLSFKNHLLLTRRQRTTIYSH